MQVEEGDKLSGKRFKIFFFPASAWAGKKENSAVRNGTVLVFFLKEKENEFKSDPKMVYDRAYRINIIFLPREFFFPLDILKHMFYS
jgi:hypothetical protein